jgi:ASC-1-like (ASCH) protein
MSAALPVTPAALSALPAAQSAMSAALPVTPAALSALPAALSALSAAPPVTPAALSALPAALSALSAAPSATPAALPVTSAAHEDPPRETAASEGAVPAREGLVADFALRVQNPWFASICRGGETVEGRVGPPEKFAGRVGCVVRITCAGDPELSTQSAQSVACRVVGVRHYHSLDEYLRSETWQRTAPHTGSFEGARAAYSAVRPVGAPSAAALAGGVCATGVFADEKITAGGGICALELALC